METVNVTWGTVPPIQKHPMAKWQRTAGVDDAGQVWVPAAVAGSENMVLLGAAFDNEPVIYRDDHLYVRTAWLRREFADTAETLDAIEGKVKAALEHRDGNP